MFNNEKDFEVALIQRLAERCGWDKNILKYKTEEELIANWKGILFENNRRRDCLNDVPLTETEMDQVIAQVNAIHTPLKMNDFINGKAIAIRRDNPEDPEHLGKEVSLKIYDRLEIAGGTSRYQIAEQPIFKGKSQLGRDRRGDFMLLINGMPLIHVELKKTGIPVSQAYNQIEKYSKEGVFSSGIYSMVQVFVAMNPDETVYFANPGYDGIFNKDFYFHWADFNNEPINRWEDIAERLLSIPMAHQLIGFYTVSDNTDGVLKVMRSYQYYASNAIATRVTKRDWDEKDLTGGYIWHTTGSGKTLTSFKTAQLIASSGDADKVVFLMDRIELGTQSLLEYKGFAGSFIDVQETDDTTELISKLKSDKDSDTLIVTSIQKMNNIKLGGRHDEDIKRIYKKRVVFIVDECHRSTFGDMMSTIKNTFPMAIFFGFTGTPIHEEIGHNGLGTKDIFGNELHRYSISDGIRDKNVLGFDPCMVTTFGERDLREVIGLEQAKASSLEEVLGDEKKEKIFYYYINDCPMAGYKDSSGKYIKGIEDYIPRTQYDGNEEHHKQVVKDIKRNFPILSRGGKFHAIFATSSIAEAIIYYRLLKKETDLRVNAVFDSSDPDDPDASIEKTEAMIEMLEDYNSRYDQSFSIPSFNNGFKKDVAYRLSHKEQYAKVPEDKQLDIVIVVNQLLTGFDSKWVNTLYLDKVLEYQNLIQAFSRTNRLFNENEKPFGIIRYYRYPFTMKANIEKAFGMYSGNKPMGLFADKLSTNLQNINDTFLLISKLFENAGVVHFESLPPTTAEKGKFAKAFRDLSGFINASKLQGFVWENLVYQFEDENGEKYTVIVDLDETTYFILKLRYKELFGRGGELPPEVPYDLDGSLTEIDGEIIDYNYMNSRFVKFLVALNNGDPDEIKSVKDELHSTFAILTSEEQKYANILLTDIESGAIQIIEGKTLRDYINEYEQKANDDSIKYVAMSFSLNEDLLREFKRSRVTEEDIDRLGKFTELKQSVDISKAKEFFDQRDNSDYKEPRVRQKLDAALRDFIIRDILP